uniref:heat shock cognate 71 kDa protein-like n=1 Tax=Styela clava TaxID=7725 RepID=UPI0019396DC7|nr:heat shock cognate 71 kDa protein-like [Styela clava]
MPTIGIDLGTTNSCVATYRNGRVEIIANDRGNRVTPSYVSFNDEERLVGEAAKDEATSNCENTLCQIKRLIGRTYDDPIVQSDMQLWGFDVINDDNKPKIPVVYTNKRMIFCPEQISAIVLEEMKITAEAFLDETVTDAVITVPAYFNDAQRKATRDAGKIAGLNVIGMINEPTAAAVAYGPDRQDTEQCREDFDNKLVNHFIEELKQQHNKDISKNKRAINRLRLACEDAKRKLSSSTKAKVQVDALHDGIDFRSNITRARFEDINHGYFKQILETVKKALEDSGLIKEDIDEVVLVGGSTRVPKIREMLEKFFDYLELKKTINPDEAVAHGAAAYAEFISNNNDDNLKDFVLEDATPLAIGIEILGGGGERALTKDNHFLGEFTLSGIPVAPRGQGEADICLDINSSGVLHVSAVEKIMGKSSELEIDIGKRRLLPNEIKRMIREAEVFRTNDEEKKKRSKAMNLLEDLAYNIKKKIGKSKTSKRNNESMMGQVTEILRWMDIKQKEPVEMSVLDKKKRKN